PRRCRSPPSGIGGGAPRRLAMPHGRMGEVSPTLARSPMSRFRFSLKSLFLVLLFVSLAASNLFTSYQLKQLHEENLALRKETGRLVIKDPAKLNVVAVPT